MVTMDLLKKTLDICLFIGFIIPLLDILLGSLDFIPGIDFDGIIPFNVMCFSFALIVFSSSGLFFIRFIKIEKTLLLVGLFRKRT